LPGRAGGRRWLQHFGNVPADWSIVGTGDFNGDGKGDIFWPNTNGDAAIWLMNGLQTLSATDLGNVPADWSIAGIGDFNAMARATFSGVTQAATPSYGLRTACSTSQVPISAMCPPADQSSKEDILWRNTNGDVAIGLQTLSATDLGNVSTS
jgi:hypothetical protein